MPLLGGTTGLFRAAGGLLAGCVEGCCGSDLRCYQRFESVYICSTGQFSTPAPDGQRYCARPSTVPVGWVRTSSGTSFCLFQIEVAGSNCASAVDCNLPIATPAKPTLPSSSCPACPPPPLPDFCSGFYSVPNSLIVTVTGAALCPPCSSVDPFPKVRVSGNPPSGTYTLPFIVRDAFTAACRYESNLAGWTTTFCDNSPGGGFGSYRILAVISIVSGGSIAVTSSTSMSGAVTVDQCNRLAAGETVTGSMSGLNQCGEANQNQLFNFGSGSYAISRG